jgi:serine/threonine protein kinase
MIPHDTGELKKETRNVVFPFKYSLRRNENLDEKTEIPPIAAFISRCLRLNPNDRPTAHQLLADPWFDDMDGATAALQTDR